MAQAPDPAIELVEVIAKALVEDPEAVVVTKSGEQRNLLELSVAPDDLGKVIGKKGRTAKSIRAVLGAVGSKSNRRYSLDIVEP